MKINFENIKFIFFLHLFVLKYYIGNEFYLRASAPKVDTFFSFFFHFFQKFLQESAN